MGFLRFLQFLLAFTISTTLYSSFAMGDIIYDELSPEIYEVQLDKTDFDTLGDRDQGFKCEIIVIIVDIQNNYERQRHNFRGRGRSWSESRNDAFKRYGKYIDSYGLWHSRYNHSFAYKNCHRRGGYDS